MNISDKICHRYAAIRHHLLEVIMHKLFSVGLILLSLMVTNAHAEGPEAVDERDPLLIAVEKKIDNNKKQIEIYAFNLWVLSNTLRLNQHLSFLRQYLDVIEQTPSIKTRVHVGDTREVIMLIREKLTLIEKRARYIEPDLEKILGLLKQDYMYSCITAGLIARDLRYNHNPKETQECHGGVGLLWERNENPDEAKYIKGEHPEAPDHCKHCERVRFNKVERTKLREQLESIFRNLKKETKKIFEFNVNLSRAWETLIEELVDLMLPDSEREAIWRALDDNFVFPNKKEKEGATFKISDEVIGQRKRLESITYLSNFYNDGTLQQSIVKIPQLMRMNDVLWSTFLSLDELNAAKMNIESIPRHKTDHRDK